MVCATVRIHASPEVAAAQAMGPDLLRLAASSTPCPPNDLTMTTETQPDACVAEQVRTTRGYLTDDCVTNLRLPARGTAWPRYEKGECKGVKTFQAEGVAQARMIARNGGGVSANQQWELVALRTPTTPGRIDYLEYNAADPASDINLVEIKKGRLGSTTQTTARNQVEGYRFNFPSPGGHTVRAKPWTTPY